MLNNYYGRRRSDHCRCGLSNLYLRRKKGLGRKSLQVREYFPDPLLVGVLAIYFILSLTSNSLALFGMLAAVAALVAGLAGDALASGAVLPPAAALLQSVRGEDARALAAQVREMLAAHHGRETLEALWPCEVAVSRKRVRG